MSDSTKEKRQLKIKTGVVNRLWKEYALYKKEHTDGQVELDKMKAEGETEDYEWKLKNQVNLINESDKMVLDTQKRLSIAVAQLRELVAHAKTHGVEFQDSEELHAAEAALSESSI